jgi:hypothetical protein
MATKTLKPAIIKDSIVVRLLFFLMTTNGYLATFCNPCSQVVRVVSGYSCISKNIFLVQLQ